MTEGWCLAARPPSRVHAHSGMQLPERTLGIRSLAKHSKSMQGESGSRCKVLAGGSNACKHLASGRGASQPLSISPLPGLYPAAGNRYPAISLLIPSLRQSRAASLCLSNTDYTRQDFCATRSVSVPDNMMMDSLGTRPGVIRKQLLFDSALGSLVLAEHISGVYSTLVPQAKTATADSEE